MAARIREYVDLGIESFIFSGYPHLEESYRFAELVFPLLRFGKAADEGKISLTGPFGETMATDLRPSLAEAKP